MFITDTEFHEDNAQVSRTADLFRAVLGGGLGIAHALADAGILRPTPEQVEDLLDEAADVLTDERSDARHYPGTYQPFDLDAVAGAIDAARSALVAVAA